MKNTLIALHAISTRHDSDDDSDMFIDLVLAFAKHLTPREIAELSSIAERLNYDLTVDPSLRAYAYDVSNAVRSLLATCGGCYTVFASDDVAATALHSACAQ